MSLKYATGIFGLVTEDGINFDTDKIVSFSQYSKYKKCPKSWELHYVRKHKVPRQSISFVYGTAMHETIQSFLHTCYVKSAKSANDMDLSGMLMESIKNEYKDAVEKSGEHFSSKEQLIEYYSDGVEILKFLKSKRTRYFSTKGTKLVALELPLTVQPDPSRPNIKLQQHLDLVFYDTVTKKYLIVDIKTAKNGWNDYKKKDKATTNQLVLYDVQNVPEMKFLWDMSPMSVNLVKETDKHWYDYITSLLAIIGGTYTTLGLINRTLLGIFKCFGLDDCF